MCLNFYGQIRITGFGREGIPREKWGTFRKRKINAGETQCRKYPLGWLDAQLPWNGIAFHKSDFLGEFTLSLIKCLVITWISAVKPVLWLQAAPFSVFRHRQVNHWAVLITWYLLGGGHSSCEEKHVHVRTVPSVWFQHGSLLTFDNVLLHDSSVIFKLYWSRK